MTTMLGKVAEMIANAENGDSIPLDYGMFYHVAISMEISERKRRRGRTERRILRYGRHGALQALRAREKGVTK